MRLRWLLLATLVFVAALPGIFAITLRVYENALVRRTEAELIAQGAALGASAALLWPGAAPAPAAPPAPIPHDTSISSSAREYVSSLDTARQSEVDLSSSPLLPERPAAQQATATPDVDAVNVAARLAPAIAETKLSTLSSILMLDRQGIVLNGSDEGRSLGALPEVQSALRGQNTTVLRHNAAYQRLFPLTWISRATSIRLHYARAVMVNGQPVAVLLISRSPSALFRGMWEDRGKIGLGVLIIFALLLVLTAVLARAIVRPMENLSKAARLLASGQSTQPLRPTLEVREIRSLFDDFAVMADAIDHRSRYLRDFAAALSHEFKTPLAGIRGGIELMQDHGDTMTPAERDRFLGNMAEDSERLSQLVSRLMKLAEADMATGTHSDRVVISDALVRVRDAFVGDDFHIILTPSGPMPAVAMEAGALETVLMTLADNARQAGANTVTFSAQREGETAVLHVVDDGPGIPAGDRTRIFDPFFTSKRASGGTGLGLSIARALVESAQGTLVLDESVAGAAFTITLPLGKGNRVLA
jgi:signal transduction histidine kinase